MLRQWHWWWGLIGVAVFVLSGQYMHWAHQHLQGMADGPRLLYRSAHIYLLLAALINVALGCYLQSAATAGARKAQWVGSVAVLISPVLLAWAFFFEPYTLSLARPIARMGLYLALGGVLVHAVASRVRPLR